MIAVAVREVQGVEVRCHPLLTDVLLGHGLANFLRLLFWFALKCIRNAIRTSSHPGVEAHGCPGVEIGDIGHLRNTQSRGNGVGADDRWWGRQGGCGEPANPPHAGQTGVRHCRG